MAVITIYGKNPFSLEPVGHLLWNLVWSIGHLDPLSWSSMVSSDLEETDGGQLTFFLNIPLLNEKCMTSVWKLPSYCSLYLSVNFFFSAKSILILEITTWQRLKWTIPSTLLPPKKNYFLQESIGGVIPTPEAVEQTRKPSITTSKLLLQEEGGEKLDFHQRRGGVYHWLSL